MPQPPGPRHPINLVVASFCDLMGCSIIPIKPESVAKWRCIKGVGHCSVESFMSIGWKDRDNLDEGSLWVWLQHRQTHGFDAGLSSLPCLNTSGFTAIMWRVSFQMATSIHQIQTFQAVTIAPIPSWPQLGNQTWQVPLTIYFELRPCCTRNDKLLQAKFAGRTGVNLSFDLTEYFGRKLRIAIDGHLCKAFETSS